MYGGGGTLPDALNEEAFESGNVYSGGAMWKPEVMAELPSEYGVGGLPAYMRGRSLGELDTLLSCGGRRAAAFLAERDSSTTSESRGRRRQRRRPPRRGSTFST